MRCLRVLSAGVFVAVVAMGCASHTSTVHTEETRVDHLGAASPVVTPGWQSGPVVASDADMHAGSERILEHTHTTGEGYEESRTTETKSIGSSVIIE